MKVVGSKLGLSRLKHLTPGDTFRYNEDIYELGFMREKSEKCYAMLLTTGEIRSLIPETEVQCIDGEFIVKG